MKNAPPLLPENAYELLVQSVVDYAIYILDLEGRVSSWNAGAERTKGYNSHEIIGEHFSRFYTEEDRAGGLPAKALRTAAETGRYSAEGWRLRKDGTRFWALVVIDAIRNDRGELVGFAKITRDITDRYEAQLRLDEAREHLFQAQKMEALGQLTGGLAHDFNNLLTAILGAADLGLRQCGDNEKLRRLLDGVRASAQRGGNLTKQLLAFARRQVLEPKVIDLSELLPTTVQLLRHSLRADVELVTEISDTLWSVEADPNQLELALLNLGINARDAMPEGGTLRLIARNAALNGQVNGLVGDYVALGISDTGIGIPEEIRNRVFEPFFTTKSFGQGTGLGLSQAYGFAQQSKGTITVESEVGRGTTVTIYLPSRTSIANGSTVVEANEPVVLVVEDDPFVADLAAELVREIGFEPHVAHSAADALAALSRIPAIQLVFSDVIMPGGMSGLELARKIRSRYPELPILLTTGYSEAVGSMRDEFPLITKPYDIDQLSTSLGQLISRTGAGPLSGNSRPPPSAASPPS